MCVCMCVIDVSELVRSVAQLAHLVGDTIVQGSATAHMVSVDQAEGEWKSQDTRIHLDCNNVLWKTDGKKLAQKSKHQKL